MSYDVEDYIEEFGELTAMGMSCREIVARSIPSSLWFRRKVFPHVGKAKCIICKGTFDPGKVTRGTECSPVCRNTYTGFGKPNPLKIAS